MAKKTTAVAKKEESQVTVKEEHRGLLEEDSVDGKDLLLGRVTCVQGLSKLFRAEKARIGQICDSLTGKLLCEKGKKEEVILFKPYKTWMISETVGQRNEFRGIVPFSPENADWEWTVEEDGKKYVRQLCQNYYTLFPQEIAAGDYRPRGITFKSSGYKTGRKVETARAFLQKMGLSLPFKVFEISALAMSDGQNDWYINDLEEKRMSEDVELDAVKEWIGLLDSKNVSVDTSDLETDTTKTSSGSEDQVKDTDKY